MYHTHNQLTTMWREKEREREKKGERKRERKGERGGVLLACTFFLLRLKAFYVHNRTKASKVPNP